MPTLLASSLRSLGMIRDGVVVGSSGTTFTLTATGASRVRREPSAVRSSCRCVEQAMVCRRDIRVEGACPDVQELETIEEYGDRVGPATQFTPDGRFRIDRIEADHARITRLADGERIWVRVFGDVLLVQADDGHFYASDRVIADRIWIRDGVALTSAPLVPLTSRADALYDEQLVARFFAAPTP